MLMLLEHLGIPSTRANLVQFVERVNRTQAKGTVSTTNTGSPGITKRRAINFGLRGAFCSAIVQPKDTEKICSDLQEESNPDVLRTATSGASGESKSLRLMYDR